jgi:PilZ domain
MDSRHLVSPSKAAIISVVPQQLRRAYRHQIQRLFYLTVGKANGGIIRNLGEAGIGIQAVASLCPNQEVFLRFDLASPRTHVEAKGRVAWANAGGQAGIEFLFLPERSRRLLKEWIFIQLLAIAQQTTEKNFFEGDEQTAELQLSGRTIPAICFEPNGKVAPLTEEEGDRSAVLHLSWFPLGISAAALSRAIDGLVVLSAVLLFAVICIAMIGTVPAWPLALLLGVAVTSILAMLYWFLFFFWIGGTPGSFLAELTEDRHGESDKADDRPRFR